MTEAVFSTLIRAADPRWVKAHRAVRVRGCREECLHACATARLQSGRRVSFRLEVRLATEPAPHLTVTERPPRRIPSFCPERHLYEDGSFCLGRFAVPPPSTLEQARLWWRLVSGYLELQVEAELLGEWDPRFAWPHGIAAARAVATAEDLEESLPEPVRALLRGGQTAPPGQPCPCGSRRSAAQCHLPVVHAIVGLRNEATLAEARFWASRADKECCGTMKNCPLRQSTLPIYQSSRPWAPRRLRDD